MCDKFIILTERKQILSQQRRFFVCLKVGNVLKDCPSSQKKACCHCSRKEYHNRCLCPQKIPRQETDALLVTEPGQSFSENNADPTSSADESNRSMTTVNSNATPMLLASGERIMLQIATVPIQSLDWSVTITVHVLLDSASQRTFMTDHLARELKLVSKHKELLSVSTVGAEKASNVDTYVVQFRVKIKDGSHMLMFANVLQQITGNVLALATKGIEFLQLIPQDKMANPVPHALESATIDLLVGSDYFWHIIGGDRIMLPSRILCYHPGLVISLLEDILKLKLMNKRAGLVQCLSLQV